MALLLPAAHTWIMPLLREPSAKMSRYSALAAYSWSWVARSVGSLVSPQLWLTARTSWAFICAYMLSNALPSGPTPPTVTTR
ncbi:hypothetical protein D3C81_1942910 [compost metagenome]